MVKSQTTPTTASRSLAATLVRGILDGTYPAGDKLPAEREMSHGFGVSRHVVREALKRLEALGFLRIRHGSGAYVKDVILTGGLELFEYLLFNAKGELDLGILRDFFTFWSHVLREVMRLAALGRTDEDLRQLKNALAERAKALHDLPKLVQVDDRLLRAIARATHNSIYQLVFNNTGRAFTRLRAKVPLDKLAPVVTQDHLERIVEAIADRDPEVAALLAVRQAELAQKTVMGFVGAL